MKNRLTICALGCALGVVIGLAALADADTIQARFDGVSPRQDVEYSIDGGANYSSTQAGYFRWTRTGGTYAGPGAAGEYITFCMELTQHIAGGETYDYLVLDPADAPLPSAGMGTDHADRVSELFGRFYADDFDAMHAAAFQSAVWELVFDDGLRIDDGVFRIGGTGDTQTMAQTWLDAIDGTGPRISLLAMASESVQDQIFMVPSPATGLLLSFGLIASAGRRRRQ